ncbi:MAG: 2-oxoisovalerate dehydrogenase [Myxococcales bacterium]|nr:2-oxoisovalerate dehydrogenase [Myxococcales bacterium]|tara:strand:+ start:1165 stop:3246 length:2082 start_codon:yes stop_codon:yes gene_type:complete
MAKPKLRSFKTGGNLKAPTKAEQVEWYRLMHRGRRLDDEARKYIRKGMGWGYHAAFAGHDGIQLHVGLAFRGGTDFMFPYYRDTLTNLAGGVSLYELILNGLSRADDPVSGGRHMSNHFGKPEIGIQNVSSCTGNHYLHAVGTARAIKYYRELEGVDVADTAIAVASTGDSATSEGYCFEALNGASNEKLPVLFVIQNNHYGISVPLSNSTANHEQISKNFSGLGNLHIEVVDGGDPYDCWRGVQNCLEYIRSGAGPALIEADCVRIDAHSNSDRQTLYRDEEELAAVAEMDPLPAFRAHLIKSKIATEKSLTELEATNDADLAEMQKKAEAAATPDPATVLDYVTPPGYEGNDDVALLNTEEKWRIREAINETLKAEFRHNPDTFVWGQDCASKEKGGVFNVTKGLLQEFGAGRVRNAPIAEDFIVGTANGMCRYKDDIAVVIEAAQFADYVWPAMEQIVETSHDYYRSNGVYSPAITARLASCAYIGGGLYHSQTVEGLFSALPGVRLVMPAFADDAAGLLRTCMRSRGLNFFLEPKFLYNQIFAQGPKVSDDYAIPFGKAKIRRPGTHISVITYGIPVHFALRSAKKLEAEGIDVEVLDLRSIKPFDEAAVLETVKKTGRVIVASEDSPFGTFAGEVSAWIAQNAFDWLDAPVTRVTSKEAPVAFSRILEDARMVNEAQITQGIRDLLAY